MKKILFYSASIFAFWSCQKSVEELPSNTTQQSEINTEIELEEASLTTGLVAHYRLNEGSGDDYTSNNNNGTSYNVTSASDRNGSAGRASRFNGTSSYINIPDKSYLSISTTGKLSISVWMKVETLNFPVTTNDYVHWIGKGTSNQHEYTLRVYNQNSDRPSRISCYAFNLSGGLGAGSYVQEPVSLNQWIHIVAVYDKPNNAIKIYKNGVLKKTSTFSSYSITPQNGSAPLRVGTRDFANYFKGVLDELRIYNRVLTQSEITSLSGN